MSELQIIRTNRNAHIEFRQLASGESVAVIDNFLVTPDDLRAYASRHAKDFTMPPKSYPGIVMAMDAKPMADIYRFIRSTLGHHFSFLRGGARFETYQKPPCYITESNEIAERLDLMPVLGLTAYAVLFWTGPFASATAVFWSGWSPTWRAAWIVLIPVFVALTFLPLLV